MSSATTKRPEACGHENCGSRRFHVGDDGFTYCDRGHQQSERGTVVAEDTGEFVIAGRKARRKDSEAESTTSRASGLSGPRAFEHYLLCLQLVLRKQLRWLIETKKLPEELETLVRDLWALRLQRLRTRVSYDSESETDTQSHYFSSQSEGETFASEASARNRKQNRTRIDGTPNVLDTLALCYMGTLLLREPVLVADIHRWVSDGELPYYHAAKNVPIGMRERLPPVYQELLEPTLLGKPEKLQNHVLEVLASLNTEFGIALPPINYPLILYRWMRALALPIEVFAATSRLARLLDIAFAFTLDAKLGTKNLVLRYPEVQLMAVLVVATKLLFPFDDNKRAAASATAMDALAMNWSAWTELQVSQTTDGDAGRPFRYEEALDYSQTDVLGASEHQLDQYMDWCEHNIASEDIRERGKAGRDADFRRILFGMFPVREDGTTRRDDPGGAKLSDDVEAEQLRTVQAALQARRIVEQPDPGQIHASGIGGSYRRIKTAGELEGPDKVFYERASELAGLSLDAMVKAVSQIERKLQKHEEKVRKGGED
ncbi:hypothetical protein B0A55_00196 [Friedmanniomyces simplex]|uniref:Uncharacterized protein n=1 Tax=Friedmanniomyces simplex TaxID=329884 RepID=A0A4U0Y0M4_9PEZI|nr:hypothetical protein B0A55_00196 [Friedmanniomyces simplex]